MTATRPITIPAETAHAIREAGFSYAARGDRRGALLMAAALDWEMKNGPLLDYVPEQHSVRVDTLERSLTVVPGGGAG